MPSVWRGIQGRINIPTFSDNGTTHMKYCLWHPRNKVKMWTGHIHVGNRNAFVGYCSDSCSKSGYKENPQICKGCSGNFMEKP